MENLFIAGTARFIGDSVYKTIAIEPGAVLEGKCAVSKGNAAAVADKEAGAGKEQ